MTATRRLPVPALIVATAILAGLAAGYTAYWFHVAGLVSKTLVAWSDDHRAAGWQVAYAGPHLGGYPLGVAVRLDDPAITLPGGLGWRAEHLTAATGVFDLHRVTLDSPGRHVVSFGPLAAAFTAASLHAEIDLDSAGRPRQAALSATALAVDGTGTPAAGIESLTLSATRLEPAPPLTDQSALLAFDATATGLRLPAAPGPALDRRIDSVALSGKVLGRPPPAGGPLDALRRWSAAGGTVVIDHLAMDWAPMALEGDGTLALDPALQPLAAFSLRVRGTGSLMDRLAAAGAIPADAAAAAKLMLALMARPDARGRPAVPVPVTLQGGWLWLGPARLARLPALPWPPAPPAH